MAGFCDIEQRLCLALALWNGRDPILKERAFGLTGAEGNHGEDVKEYWWYRTPCPATPGTAGATTIRSGHFPTSSLLDENRRRGKLDREYELLDTGIFDDDRYWVVDVHYTKADPTDMLMTINVTNAGPEAEVLHVLPTLWFRNTWSWDDRRPHRRRFRRAPQARWPSTHPFLGDLELLAGPAPDGAQPELLFCDNETNRVGSTAFRRATRWPKDGINDHVVSRGGHRQPAAQRHEMCRRGTRFRLMPGETAEIAAAVASGRRQAHPSRTRWATDFTRVNAPASGRGRRVLCRTDPDRRRRPTRPR